MDNIEGSEKRTAERTRAVAIKKWNREASQNATLLTPRALTRQWLPAGLRLGEGLGRLRLREGLTAQWGS